MPDRDELIAQIAAWPAERAAARPQTPGDFRMYDPAVADAMAEAGVSDVADVFAYARRHRALMLAAANGHEVLVNYDGGTREFIARTRDRLAGELMPPPLRSAIARMQGEIEHRKQIGFEDRSFSQLAGGSTTRLNVSRTPADDAATVRAEQALGRLRALAYVAGDLDAAIRQILIDLHEADLAALWTPVPAAKPARRRTAATSAREGDLVGAVIEPEDSPRPERLFPAL